MKKKILLILLTLLLVPKLTYAEELPREGVHYFLNYPNDEEVVTKNYDEIENEILLYNGKTNENGEIILTDWNEYGQLRIVQKVPSGYSTDQKEIIVDLSDKKASFIDYRGITNPETGRSILLTTILLGTIISLIILVKTKDKKKYLLIIPVITILCLNVKAESEGFVISVKDRQGNSLKDVEISVYAKPNKKEAYPAMEIHANGGKFLGNQEKIYVKLPKNGVTQEEFNNSMTEEAMIDYFISLMSLYKEGYIPNLESTALSEEKLTNDTITYVDWIKKEELPIEDIKYITIHGNGEKIRLNGKKYDEIKIMDMQNSVLKAIFVYPNIFNTKAKRHLVGLDYDSSCSNYDSHGLLKENSDNNVSQLANQEDMYLCWNNKPDGIYINGKFTYKGNYANCMNKTVVYSKDNNIYTLSNILTQLRIEPNSNLITTRKEIELKSIEIIENGNTIVRLTENDFEKVVSSDDDNNIMYKIQSNQALNSYLSKFNNCTSTIPM